MTSIGRAGVASRFSMVPSSRSRVTASAVISTMVTVRMTREQAGHDVEPRLALGIVAALQHELDGFGTAAQRFQRTDQVARQRLFDRGAGGGQRVGRRHRIGGVGVDQHLRALAADQAAREVGGMRTTNCTSPRCSRALASLSLSGRWVKSM